MDNGQERRGKLEWEKKIVGDDEGSRGKQRTRMPFGTSNNHHDTHHEKEDRRHSRQSSSSSSKIANNSIKERKINHYQRFGLVKINNLSYSHGESCLDDDNDMMVLDQPFVFNQPSTP
eukprot:scaffold651_cov174-Ochromonas_danica.AAC.11